MLPEDRIARYVAFLRGVSPLSLKMPALAGVLEDCGLTGVRTVLSSGNAVFDTTRRSPDALQRRIEAALQDEMGRTFKTFVRAAGELGAILERAGVAHPAGTKPIVVFLRQPPPQEIALPVEGRSFALQSVTATEAYGYYTPGSEAAAYMTLLERAFGHEFTTRTVQTVRRCASAIRAEAQEGGT